MNNGVSSSRIDRDKLYIDIPVSTQKRMGVTGEDQKPEFQKLLEIQADMKKNGPNLGHVSTLKDIALSSDWLYTTYRLNASKLLEIRLVPETEFKKYLTPIVGQLNIRDLALSLLTKALVDDRTDGQTKNGIIAILKELAAEERDNFLKQGSPRYIPMKLSIAALMEGLVKNLLTKNSVLGEVIPDASMQTKKKALGVLAVAEPGILSSHMITPKIPTSIRMASVYRLKALATDSSPQDSSDAFVRMYASKPLVHGCTNCKVCSPVAGALKVAINEGAVRFISNTYFPQMLESLAANPDMPVSVRLQSVERLGKLASDQTLLAQVAFDALDSVSMFARDGKSNEDAQVREAAKTKLKAASKANGFKTKTRTAIDKMAEHNPFPRQPRINNRNRPLPGMR